MEPPEAAGRTGRERFNKNRRLNRAGLMAAPFTSTILIEVEMKGDTEPVAQGEFLVGK
jgi:hypothetical protein